MRATSAFLRTAYHLIVSKRLLRYAAVLLAVADIGGGDN